MRLVVRLYAVCRELAGTDRLELQFSGDSASLSSLIASLSNACPAIAPLLPTCRVAVNREIASNETRISEGDEVAIIPPVSGGSGLGPFTIGPDPIDARALERAVSFGGAGAIVLFEGVVRDRTGDHDVVALEYEAYDEMALQVLRKIGGEVIERWPSSRIAIAHRVGRLTIGEASVVIAVSSPHRAAAFEACRHAIERLKQDVPIWKKEIRKDGSIWVGMGS